MADLIDRQALVEQMESDAEQMEDMVFKMATYAAINDVKHQPAADVAPARHGHWIHVCTELDGNALYECSICGKGEIHVPIVEVKYCWNCGARMDGEKNG